MTKVAADYGASDVAMKKICDKHRIPVHGSTGRKAMPSASTQSTADFPRCCSSRISVHGSGAELLCPKQGISLARSY